MALDPATYLNEVLDYIQHHSIKRATVDWAVLRCQAVTLAAGARTTAETYPAISLVLDRLGDRHSFFVPPDEMRLRREGGMKSSGLVAVYPEGVIVHVLPGSPAEQAGVREGDIIELINDELTASVGREGLSSALRAPTVGLRLKRPGQEQPLTMTLHAAAFPLRANPVGRHLAPGIGYLELPAMIGTEEQVRDYAATAQQVIRQLDQAGTHGWVVDLRRNTGGNMWPMLAGAGPLLGEGHIGAFVSTTENTPWIYRAGQLLLGQYVLAQVDQPYELQRPGPPVAVLISRLTASSGELTLLAFRARPQTRSFGEPTAGVPTANGAEELRDGAMVCLTIALGADRTGQSYDGPIPPDQPISSDWMRFGSQDDPVLQAAVGWLRQQESAAT